MTSDELSHPEILSPEKLREILCSRGLLPQDLKDKEKDELVTLCHQFVVPLPQRDKQLRRARRKETMRLPRDRVSTGTKRKSMSDEAVGEISNEPYEGRVTLKSPTTDCLNKITKLDVTCFQKPMNEHAISHYSSNDSYSSRPKKFKRTTITWP